MFFLWLCAVIRHPRAYRKHMAYVREQNKYLDGLPYDENIYRVEYLDNKEYQ